LQWSETRRSFTVAALNRYHVTVAVQHDWAVKASSRHEQLSNVHKRVSVKGSKEIIWNV
jgi:hypothetical protein